MASNCDGIGMAHGAGTWASWMYRWTAPGCGIASDADVSQVQSYECWILLEYLSGTGKALRQIRVHAGKHWTTRSASTLQRLYVEQMVDKEQFRSARIGDILLVERRRSLRRES